MTKPSDTPWTEKLLEYLAEQFPATAGHIPLREELQDKERELDATRSQLGEWMLAFGTSQLSHAVGEYEGLRASVAELERALHECYAWTGEDAGDIDDFRALENRVGRAVDAVQQLRLAKDELEKDKARLDWLSRNHYGVGVDTSLIPLPALVSKSESPYVRQAIDAAMKGNP